MTDKAPDSPEAGEQNEPSPAPGPRAAGDVEALTGALMAARAELSDLRQRFASEVEAAGDRVRAELEKELANMARDRQVQAIEGEVFRGLDPGQVEAARTMIRGLIAGGDIDPALPGAASLARTLIQRAAGSMYSAAPRRSEHGFHGRTWSDLSMGERQACLRSPELMKTLSTKVPGSGRE